MSPVQKVVQFLQFGQTQRWHTEVNLKSQDVAQHSYNVAWFCWFLSDGNPSAALLMGALAHDAGERKTGDMPAPTKLELNAGAKMDEMEAVHLVKTGFYALPLSKNEAQILKLADSLEGAFFCLRELKLGNRLVLNKEWNGAASNYLAYLSNLVPFLADPHAHKVGLILFNYLKDEYGRYADFERP